MLPKMEKREIITKIYADILIFANLCQFLPIGNIGKNEAAPPPPPPPPHY